LTTSILEPLKRADVPVVQTLHEYRLVCPVSNLYAHGTICEDCRGHAFWHAILKRCNRGKLSRSILSVIESYVSSMMGSVSKIDHFIAVSDFLRNKLIELGIPADKITAVHNFIDVSNIAPFHNKGTYFLYFGRLEKIKGIFTLLEAVAPLKDIPLFIAGEGEARVLVESYIEKHSLNHVKLIGFKKGTELNELIRNSICTITPSEWFETFGLTLIESFARGRPVIASNIGGMSEVVSDSSDGFLIPPKNADMLRDKMIWFWLHRNEAIEMGRSGRKKVELYFNPDIHYERILHIYRNLM
jgi:glycosyltransferase involved in cell wall biosynthesis